MSRSEIIQASQPNPEQTREAQEQLQAIMVRSATDMDFRNKLMTDPRTALKEFTGRELPADRSIKFVASEGKQTLVLPPFVGTDAELDDAELETVSGGAFWVIAGAAVLTLMILREPDCSAL